MTRKLSRYHLKWPENFPDVALNFPRLSTFDIYTNVYFGSHWLPIADTCVFLGDLPAMDWR